MNRTEAKCPICNTDTHEQRELHWPDFLWYFCKQCGDYAISVDVRDPLQEDDLTRSRLACLARERHLQGKGWFLLCEPGGKPDPEGTWSTYEILEKDELLRQFPEPADVLPRAMLNLSRPIRSAFETLSYSHKELVPLLFCTDESQERILLHEIEALDLIRPPLITTGGARICLTTRGWEYVRDLSRQRIDSQQCFVAMCFDGSTEEYYKGGMRPAIKKAGYNCFRVDEKEDNEKVCDIIVAEIRKSRFLVVDTTGQRGGVYFEAGYGMGLGLEVIWLVHEDHIKKLHFDIRQYRHIVYSSPEDLKKQLYNRIAATVGLGPVKHEAASE